MSKNAIVLLSGGLDSATCLAYAVSEGYSSYAISFDYGQKHSIELEAAKKVASLLGALDHRIIKLDSAAFQNSSLTDQTLKVHDYKCNTSGVIPDTYVPARNTIFLSYGLGFAEVIEADAIFIGANAVDYSGYPDCRPEYLSAFEVMANLATKRAVEGNKIKILSPILHLSKADIIKLGCSLGVDYSITISCYRANSLGEACGKCDSCIFRKKGFLEADIPDPTLYIK